MYRPLCLQDVSGMSLSMLAAAGGHDDILRLLIRKGVRVNNRQKNGTTALMHAAEKVRHLLTDSYHHHRLINCITVCGLMYLFNCYPELSSRIF